MKVNYKNVGYAVFAVLYTAAFAFLAGYFTDARSEWFLSLNKGPLMPPDIAFAVIWFIIYILLMISFTLVLITSEGKSGLPFMINAALLALWCYVFFYRHNINGGLLLIAAITLESVLLFGYAYKKNRTAGYLLLPFIAWMGYATALNYHIALLN